MKEALLLPALAAVLVLAGLPRASDPPAVPPPCDAPVLLDDADDGTSRLACATPGQRAGRRYSIGRGRTPLEAGPMPGALLAMHRLPLPVNEASAADLRAVPSIGAGLARRLVEARADGPFCGVEDLERVRGIGPVTARAIAGAVTFNHPDCGSDPGR